MALGELEDLIRKAIEEAPVLDGDAVVGYLAERLEPHVVLRDQLEHVGWYDRGDMSQVQEDGYRPMFCIPARTVHGTAESKITMTIAGDS